MTLRVIDYTAPAPELNLALEEAILDAVETGRSPSTLRFWECAVPFAVLGVSQSLALETDAIACEAEGIPILRRCSAGGAVLQGPGSLNFALTLRYDEYPDTRALRASYDFILGNIAASFRTHGVEVTSAGCSDLAIGGLKVSGNAQKRRKHAFLHHGSLLYAVDAGLIARCLREPRQRPDYRGERTHAEFVTVLPMTRADLVAAVCKAFDAPPPDGQPSDDELRAAGQLAAEKYANPAWTQRR